MHRVLIPACAVRDDHITVNDPRQLRHLHRVLRVKSGDELECFDGAGHRYRGPVVRCSRAGLVMQVAARETDCPPSWRLTLAQALIRQERFDWVIQKATELGVERIVPLITAHTVIRPAKGQWPRKAVRWRRIAEEAAQQCGRSTVPAIEVPVSFARFAPSLAHQSGVVMPTLAIASTPLSGQLERLKGMDAAVALIGPEGDFTRDEAALAQRYGASLASLGRLTLRSETAAIVTLALLRYAADIS